MSADRSRILRWRAQDTSRSAWRRPGSTAAAILIRGRRWFFGQPCLCRRTPRVGFALGVQYGDSWGHRGATHSLAIAAVVGLVIGLAAQRFNRRAGRTGVTAFLVLASHGLLDTMTDGGLGCALLWPFDLTRYFAPWRPIPVAPIGPAFLSGEGALVALTELVLFCPLLVYALGLPRLLTKRAAGGLLVAWMTAVWLISSADAVREAIVGFALREDTAYASGYSDKAFRRIALRTPISDVRRLLGPPIGERWFYSAEGQSAMTASAATVTDGCSAIGFEHDVVATAINRDACRKRGIEPGLSRDDVEQLLGSPQEACWQYSWSPQNRRFRLRVVCFLNGRVETLLRRWDTESLIADH